MRDVKRAILAFVFVGSKTAPLNDMTLRPAQPFLPHGCAALLSSAPAAYPNLAAAGSRCVHRHAAGRVDASGGRRSLACGGSFRTVRRPPSAVCLGVRKRSTLLMWIYFLILRIAERRVQNVKIGATEPGGRRAIEGGFIEENLLPKPVEHPNEAACRGLNHVVGGPTS